MNSSRDPVIASGRGDRDINFRNDLEIQFFGLQRSGNHAILSWLFQQFEEPVYFLNMVKPFTDPILNWRFAGLPNTVDLPRGPGEHNPRAEMIRLRRLQTLEEIRLREKRVLVHSYENMDLTKLGDRTLLEHGDVWLGRSKKMVRVLLLRDFYNWIASRIRLLENKHGRIPRDATGLVSLWLRYAREYVGETTFLGCDDVVTVSFSRWVADEIYRRALLERLGIPPRDLAVRHLAVTGGGSSFDALSFASDPQAMRVEQRWNYLLESRLGCVIDALRDRQDEIEHYNVRIFGMVSPLRDEESKIVGS